jgi:branched-chain amino acid transport system permease protein
VTYIYPGIVIGALYALLGGGITLTYSLTGVINLAVGSIAYAAAYLFYWLVTLHSWSPWAAGLCTLAFAPLLGFVIWYLIFRHLEDNALIVQLVATIGLAVAIPALMQLLLQIGSVYQTPGLLPQGFAKIGWLFFDSTRDQFAAVVGAVVCLGVVYIFIERSPVGLSARAVVDRPRLAQGVGINTGKTSAMAWILSSLLTGAVGILISPLIQLDEAQYTSLAVAALSVALVGRFRSLAVTALAGICLGLASSLITGYAPIGSDVLNGLVPALPFFLLVGLLLLQRTSWAGRRDVGVVVQRQAAGSPGSDLRQRYGAGGRRLPTSAGLAVVLAGGTLLAVFGLNAYWTGVVAAGSAFAVLFLSFTVSTGEGGVLCLGQAGFAATGAFLAGRLAAEASVPLILAAVIGVAGAALCGVMVGVIGTRLDQTGFALVTLSFGLFCESFAFNIQSLIPASGVTYPTVAILGLNFSQSATVINVVCFALIAVLIGLIRRGRFGRIFAAVRGNPLGGESIGINVKGMRVAIFAAGCGAAGLGGVLIGVEQGAVATSDFSLLTGLVWLAVVVTVGVRAPSGALVAGLAFSVVPAVFGYIDLNWIGYLPTALFGLGAIGLARQPRGFVYQVISFGRSLGRPSAGKSQAVEASPSAARSGAPSRN